MKYQFVTSIMNKITAAYTRAQAGEIQYGDVYKIIADAGVRQTGVDKGSIAWLYGAADVNKGVGAFSTFIREYSKK
jgi:hypothetical protein